MPNNAAPLRGLTVRDVARLLRVGPDKVRAWIKRGDLSAVNTASAMCGRPRWVILPQALAQFALGRQAVAPPTPRKRKRTSTVDYYPE